MDFVLIAIPFFFFAIAFELIAERVRGTDYYRLNDALTSLSTGTLNQVVKFAQSLIPFVLYLFVYEHFSVLNLGKQWWVWVFAFVAYDLVYYWNHRLGHEISILWAAHVVHHSSEEYNLTTALRQTGTGFLSVLFSIPLALIGVEPVVLVSVAALNLIYQFWVHTRHVPKLGWLDYVFVTPSNHRAHHAQNAVYIDKNYGGVFILWDRLFGTFQEELDDHPPIYGIRGALNSWNPIWANCQVYSQLLQDAKHTSSWWNKLTIWFRRTGWRPDDVIQAYPLIKTDLEDIKKYDTPTPPLLKLYCLIQYAINVVLILMLSLATAHMTTLEQLQIVGLICLSSFGIGSMLEHKHYAGVFEVLRLSMALVLTVLSVMPLWMWSGLTLALSISLTLLWFARQQSAKHLSELQRELV